jgi:hypothetical protein
MVPLARPHTARKREEGAWWLGKSALSWRLQAGLPNNRRRYQMAAIDAATQGDADALAALLAASPELAHERDANGNTPLHVAAEGSSATPVAALLAAGAEADARNSLGETPLLRHVKRSSFAPDDVEVLSLLLAHGADVNAADSEGVSPLIEAAFEGKSPLLARMLQPDANANLAATLDGQGLLAMARTPADRRLLHRHRDSPVGRLSSAFKTASRRSSLGAVSRAPMEPLLVRTAALGASVGRGVVGTACLGEVGPLAASTGRLAHGSMAGAFAADAPPLPSADEAAPEGLDAAFARVALGGDADTAARPARPPPSEVVERRALRMLLPTPPSAWVPPQPGDPFCLPTADVLDLCTRAHSLFSCERCASPAAESASFCTARLICALVSGRCCASARPSRSSATFMGSRRTFCAFSTPSGRHLRKATSAPQTTSSWATTSTAGDTSWKPSASSWPSRCV